MRNLLIIAMLSLVACGRGFEAKQINWKEPGSRAIPVRVQVLTYDQVNINHKLGPDSQESYSQRNFVSTTFAKDSHAPVIFYLCGEWTCSQRHIDNLVGDYAKRLGAVVVGAEHRFYGESIPRPGQDLTLDDMKYLRTELAIEDLAETQRKIMTEYHLDGPWIVVGGSYAGTLATYYRLAHPDLAKGAVTFSAPIEVMPQGMTDYEKVATDAFGEDLNGKIRKATDFIFKSLDNPDFKTQLQQKMNLPNANFDKEDIAAILANMIPEVSQYGQVATLKQALASETSDEGLSTELINALVGIFGTDFWKESPYGMKEDPNFKSDMSKWLYQAYTDYGWIYVTNPDVSKSLLPIPVNVNHYKERFDKMYAGRVGYISSNYSANMLEKFLKAGRFMLRLHGTIDPWIGASLPNYVSDPLKMFTFIVTGGSHCGPMGGVTDDPTSPDYEPQQLVLKTIKAWSTLN